MFRRVKQWLKKWLQEEEEAVNPILSSHAVSYRIVGAIGMRLIGQPINGQGATTQRLLGELEADDPKQFWKLWKQFGGAAAGWHWEDGEQVNFPMR